MNRFLSLAVLIVGIALLIAGFNASDSIGSDFSRFFTGSPTEKSIWLLLGGAACCALGAGGIVFSGTRAPRQ